MRNCKTCGSPLIDGSFYKSNVTHCKGCVRAAVTRNRNANIESVRAYDRARGRTDEHRAICREYAKKNPEIASRAKVNYSARNPLKRKATVAVSNAVRDGRLLKQPCEKCGNSLAEAHHDDYSKPLDVRWLCDFHHKEHHREERAAARVS